MSEIGELIQAYQDKHGTSDRALAARTGLSNTLIGKWKKGQFAEVPGVESIHALADQIAVDRRVVLAAFLRDLNYLPKDGDGDGEAAPMNVDPLSEGATNLTGTDLEGLPSVAHKPRDKGRQKD